MIREREMRSEDRIECKQVKEKRCRISTFSFLEPADDRYKYLRKDSEESLAKSYAGLPEKEKIIEELLRLSSDPDPQIRRGAIDSFLTIYSLKSGKEQDIWNELLKISGDTDTGVRKGAASMLSRVFPVVEEKSTVFSDLVKLAESPDSLLRKKAAELFTVAFAYSDDKQKTWNDLMRLTSAEDREVRKEAVLALSSGYSEVPDKAKVWSDLIRLSTHGDNFVQRVATRTLGSAFFYVPDKTQALKDLQVLIGNPYIYVRMYALRSLGKASLWKALKAENEATYLFGLKEAVKYFKDSTEASTSTAIPGLYYPFYNALLQILFGRRSSRLESEQYISEVTHEIKYLEEDKRLLKIMEEFSDLLLSAGNLTAGDLPARKKLLEASIEAFDRASGILDIMEEDAILEQKNLRKECSITGKVITEQKLKEILSGIRYKARTACFKAKGKPTEKITCAVNERVKTWSFQDLEKDRKELDRQLESLLSTLRVQIPFIPENMSIFQKLDDISQEQCLLERYRHVSRLLSLIPGAKMYSRASGKRIQRIGYEKWVLYRSAASRLSDYKRQ
ncbi:MAG: HEAT repeat domain-containing protein [Methanosarcina flavescens]|nr:HEAT repeat domain-containing protein [Methanosarcina flavescens]NLK32716.1 HEAT repeat domain-containing protein [Methanosarcina flavescens]